VKRVLFGEDPLSMITKKPQSKSSGVWVDWLIAGADYFFFGQSSGVFSVVFPVVTTIVFPGATVTVA